MAISSLTAGTNERTWAGTWKIEEPGIIRIQMVDADDCSERRNI